MCSSLVASRYAEYPLPDAHGVLWDPGRSVLWAVGETKLVALAIEGTTARIVIRETLVCELPSRYGHDLAPVCGNADRLWVTTNTEVCQFVKSTGTWTMPEAANGMNRPFVKSVGNTAAGRIAQTVPQEGSLYMWATDTVDLFAPYEPKRLEGAAIYKARFWSAEYR